MWSTDHIANYMNFTTAPAFRLNPAYPYEEDLAKYGIDASKLSEADYTRAIGQLKSEIRKTVAEFRTAYAQKQIDNDGYVKFLKVTVII
jgi:hypothetical protein